MKRPVLLTGPGGRKRVKRRKHSGPMDFRYNTFYHITNFMEGKS
jgi:hypothetical protein